GAMHAAATALVELRGFLAAQDPATLATNEAFRRRREELSRALGGVVATTDARFDDPWHVIAMDAAAARKGVIEAVVITTPFAARYTDLDTGAALTAA